MTSQDLTAMVPVIVLLAGVLGVAFAVFRTKASQTRLTILEELAKTLEGALHAEREERKASETRVHNERQRERSKCDQDIARLQGQVDTLKGPFVADMVKAVVKAVHGAD